MDERNTFSAIFAMTPPARTQRLRAATLAETRYLSIDQAIIVTDSYQRHSSDTKILQRAYALADSLKKIDIRIDPDEIIVGNRTPGIRSGVVFPEAGVAWLESEIDSLSTRPQDTFEVDQNDIPAFFERILPAWKETSLEYAVKQKIGAEASAIARVVKINQQDHAQGHICPDVANWLKFGPLGLIEHVHKARTTAEPEKQEFYDAAEIVLTASRQFMVRYADLADTLTDYGEIAERCRRISSNPPETFTEAIQSLWFLFVILHMESNASSFSPGRIDQYLYKYYRQDIDNGRLTDEQALEVLEALWIKFNHIVYLRNAESARYFAGFPIGFNVAIGGTDKNGVDAVNELSYLCLKAQEDIGLPQPNLSARLHKGSSDQFIDACTRVIGHGSGMPQIFNDESIIPALKKVGINDDDAADYAVVGCVELTSQGNELGWSDAAMFNLVKALELSIHNGICSVSHQRIGPSTGFFDGFSSFEEFELAFKSQIDYFMDKMISLCHQVDVLHAEMMPSPFLSTVVRDCIETGIDVTAGGATYNLSGIQAIQIANIADSLAGIKKLVFQDKRIQACRLRAALENNFEHDEPMRQMLLNDTPKYGNDISWVDELGNTWAEYFAGKLNDYKNARGGLYHAGLYTVSAHVPMGKNVGATPDGRRAGEPLADGGLSAMYGRDLSGPTALLKSVAKINSTIGSNGTLLNMKFLPEYFERDADREKFMNMLRALIDMGINHVQFNVVRPEDLIAAKNHPDQHRALTVRVAGYTAYFTELACDLQDEIIARTSYGA